MKNFKIVFYILLMFFITIVFSSCDKLKKMSSSDNDTFDFDLVYDYDFFEETDEPEFVDNDIFIYDFDINDEYEEDSIRDDSYENEVVDDIEFFNDYESNDIDFRDEEILVDDDEEEDDTNDYDYYDDFDDNFDDDFDDDYTDPGDAQVICTGMNKCFNNTSQISCPLEKNDFYGQDYQYAQLYTCISPSFVILDSESEKIVKDNFTSLEWQQQLPAQYSGCTGGVTTGSACTWQQALDYCQNLEYGGYDDWRLPSVAELSTISNYGKSAPAIDSDIFTVTVSDYYWTSTNHLSSLTQSWVVYFVNGEINKNSQTKFNYVRCVRGEIYNNVAVLKTQNVKGKNIIIDEKTNLTWADTYAIGKDWQSALKYCEDLNYAGFTDWRLPNVNEFKSLVNYSKKSPATDYPGMPSQLFWTSTTYLGYPERAWYLNFSYGEVYYHTKTNLYYATCIR